MLIHFRLLEFTHHRTWRNVPLDVVVMPEIDVVEESGAVVYVGVSISPRDLSLWDCLKWRKQEKRKFQLTQIFIRTLVVQQHVFQVRLILNGVETHIFFFGV